MKGVEKIAEVENTFYTRFKIPVLGFKTFFLAIYTVFFMNDHYDFFFNFLVYLNRFCLKHFLGKLIFLEFSGRVTLGILLKKRPRQSSCRDLGFLVWWES